MASTRQWRGDGVVERRAMRRQLRRKVLKDFIDDPLKSFNYIDNQYRHRKISAALFPNTFFFFFWSPPPPRPLPPPPPLSLLFATALSTRFVAVTAATAAAAAASFDDAFSAQAVVRTMKDNNASLTWNESLCCSASHEWIITALLFLSL